MRKRNSTAANLVFNIILMAYALVCILPILLTISVSFSTEDDVIHQGFGLLPRHFSLDAYQFVFKDGGGVLQSYVVTICNTVVGTLCSLLVISLFAYPLSRNSLKYKKFFTMYIFITMLFSGGLVPWYIVCSQVLHIRNTYFALFLPALFNAWYVIIMRTFYKTTIPDSIIESAKIDGAGELRIFARIVSPISLPCYATVGLFCTLGFWNDWWLSFVLTSEPKFRTLQLFIYRVLTEASIITQMQNRFTSMSDKILNDLPAETARFAMCVIATGPILFIYPFFQKYFIKGLTVGSVKG
jgi:putative aldouronate transport system permease protein